jgi:PAS domain S-box-containing protein
VDALRLRERAFASVSSGIVITDARQPDNPIIDVNPAFERITGYARHEVLSNNCRMLQFARTDPATVREIREALDARREIGVTILNQRRDGTPFWNDLFISPVFDPDGTLTHFVGIQTDITARKLAEDRNAFLADASEKLVFSLDIRESLDEVARLAVPTIADIFLVDLLDEEQRVERVTSRYDGLSSDQLARFAVIAPQRINERPMMEETLLSGQAKLIPVINPEWLDSRAKDPDHREMLDGLGLLSSVVVPLVARGRTLGTLSLLTTQRSRRRYDESDLRLAEDLGRRTALAIDNALLFRETQEAVRARDQFLSIAAHELRTPVSSIKGYAQMLMRAQRKGDVPVERMRRSLTTIDQASDRLSLLTSDLLDVSRIRLGQLPLRVAEIRLDELVQTIVTRQNETGSSGHRFHLEIAPGDYPVMVDADRFDQVLTNLLENAAKYSPGERAVDVVLSADGTDVRVEVRDRGIGLPPGGEEQVFEPFERAANAVERGMPGLGLGLYISRGIIERHGGRIWADSAGEDLGTTFVMEIPTAGNAPDLT